MKATAALVEVLALLKTSMTSLSGRAVKQALTESEHARNTIEAAIKLGVRTGALMAENGPRNSRLYSVSVPVSRSVPSVSQNGQSECPSAYRHGTLGHSEPSSPVSRNVKADDERF